MAARERGARGETALHPADYAILRVDKRSIPVRVHLQDSLHSGTTAFTRPDGEVISFAKRLSALVYLYQQQTPPEA